MAKYVSIFMSAQVRSFEVKSNVVSFWRSVRVFSMLSIAYGDGFGVGKFALASETMNTLVMPSSKRATVVSSEIE